MIRSPVSKADFRNFAVLFVCLFVFYLVLSGGINAFAVGTGAVSAAIVALVFTGAAFSSSSHTGSFGGQLARAVVYVPYLFWQITKANLSIAYIALHPSMPIDSRIDKYEPELTEPVPLTTFVLSVTLTPGTLVVDVRDGVCHVHSLTAGSLSDLFEGQLERAVSFVFDGRRERANSVDGTANQQTRSA